MSFWPEYQFQTIEVIDAGFSQPVGFVWHAKPRYRVKAKSRRVQ